jgi:thrombospondin type 3 repeat protein
MVAAALAIWACVASAHPLDVTDVDHDLIKNEWDNCPGNYNPNQKDSDKDAAEWAAQNSQVPDTPEETLPVAGGRVGGTYYGWTESASLPDGSADPRNRPAGVGGDSCDEDDDNDGFPDKRTSKPPYKGKQKDNCPKQVNKDQADNDRDGTGDVCDLDDDNDGVFDPRDNCPVVSNADQLDSNGDGRGDACDPTAPKGNGSLLGRNPNDHTPPRLTVSVGRVQRFAALGQGLAVPVRASEGVLLEGTLLVRNKTVGRGGGLIADKGFTYVFVSLSTKTLKRLARSRRVRVLVRVTAKDSNDNVARVSRRVVLQR